MGKVEIIKNRKLQIIIALIIAIGLVAFLPRLFNRNTSLIRAGIPEIIKTDETGFLYEFKASSFKLLMGEQEGKPNFLIKQGNRAIDVTIEGDTRVEVPTPTPTVVPTATPPAEKTTEYFRSFLKREVNAQENVSLVNTESESFVEYINSGFTISPSLEKVALEYEVKTKYEIPTLTIQPLGLVAYGDNKEVVFHTKTNRKAYSINNVLATDSGGSSITPEFVLEGHITADPVKSSDPWYSIDFYIDEGWLNDSSREYPIMVTLDLNSLFHERMIPMKPVKPTFRASEHLEFEIDTLFINDLTIQAALLSGDFTDLRFGLIGTSGDTFELNAKLKEKVTNDKIIVELWSKKGFVAAGLFDLLLQYKDNSAFISEQEVAWGVLALNPDQAVYQSGSTSKLDMAVLDKHGNMVCNAGMVLIITDPEGNITNFSTDAGTIEVTEGCPQKVTELPDYTANYITRLEGAYQIQLIAETGDGVFTIDDEFGVDDNSPFYVKRTGPTRIYPLAKYQMSLEVTSAADSGSYVVEEAVPSDFEITNTSGTVGAPLRQGFSGKGILWEETFTHGQARTFSYSFDAPDISPAIFLLGPVRLADARSGQELFSENRSWQIASDDTTGKLYPVGEGREQPSTWLEEQGGTDVGCDTATCWDAVEEASGGTSCSGGDTADVGTNDELYSSTDNDSITFDINESGITAGSTVDQMDITICHSRSSTGQNCNVQTRRCDDSTCTSSGTDIGCVSAWTDSTQTHGPGLGITSFTDLEIGIERTTGARFAHLARIRVDITFNPPGPVMNEVMRHGNWFSSGAEQYFFWAD